MKLTELQNKQTLLYKGAVMLVVFALAMTAAAFLGGKTVGGTLAVALVLYCAGGFLLPRSEKTFAKANIFVPLVELIVVLVLGMALTIFRIGGAVPMYLIYLYLLPFLALYQWLVQAFDHTLWSYVSTLIAVGLPFAALALGAWGRIFFNKKRG